jgi:hypothetical protein
MYKETKVRHLPSHKNTWIVNNFQLKKNNRVQKFNSLHLWRWKRINHRIKYFQLLKEHQRLWLQEIIGLHKIVPLNLTNQLHQIYIWTLHVLTRRIEVFQWAKNNVIAIQKKQNKFKSLAFKIEKKDRKRSEKWTFKKWW